MKVRESQQQIADESLYWHRHHDTIVFFNRLIINLTQQLLGHRPTEAITMERLEEATDHLRALEQCRTPMGRK